MLSSVESVNEINILVDQLNRVADRIRAIVAQTHGDISSHESVVSSMQRSVESEPFKASMRRYHANGEYVDLSEVEAILLERLLDVRGQLVSKAALCGALGLNPESQEQNLKSYMFRLKAKLSRLQQPSLEIKAIRGAGYCATDIRHRDSSVRPWL